LTIDRNVLKSIDIEYLDGVVIVNSSEIVSVTVIVSDVYNVSR